MDLSTLSLPDWMPWWAVVAILVPAAFYLALFLLMPFSTFGLRAKLREMEGQIEALHEEIRGLTLRLPERGPGLRGRGLPGLDDDDEPLQPPIPPAAREPRPRGAGGGFGDPVADKMLAYMRDKAQTEMNRGDMGRPEPPRPARHGPAPSRASCRRPARLRARRSCHPRHRWAACRPRRRSPACRHRHACPAGSCAGAARRRAMAARTPPPRPARGSTGHAEAAPVGCRRPRAEGSHAPDLV